MARRKQSITPRRGRPAGQKNLKKIEGGYVNQHGVVFTPEEKKRLELSVDRSNRRVKKQIAEADALNPNHAQLRLMGKQSDFIVSHQPKTLQRFKNKEEFEDFMVKQERIQSGEYLDDAVRLYKRNYMEAVRNVFGDEAKDIEMKIRMMKPEDYRKAVEGNEFLEIGYLYESDALEGKKQQIRKALGMKQKEDYFAPL